MPRLRMREWEQISYTQDASLVGFSFGDDQRVRADAEALTDAGILEIAELRQGVSVRSTSFVGRVQLGDLQITVQPKIKLDVLLTLFRYAYNLRDLRLMTDSDLDLEPEAFQDILIGQLIAEVQELLARGLQRQYKQVAANLSIPKGRINLQQIARQGGVKDAEIPVIHHPRLEDNLLNQVLLAGLNFAIPMTTDLLMRSRLRRLVSILEIGISQISLNFAVLARLKREMSRLTAHYEASIMVIELLMLASGITLEARSRQVALPGFLFDMNLFFERLLSRFLNENLPNHTVHDQFRLKDMMAYTAGHNPKRRQAPAPRPDFVVSDAAKPISILDAKYRDLWEKPLPRDMLYQLAIYALSQGWSGQSSIIYPSVDSTPKPQVIEIRDALLGANKAYITLKPVNLNDLSELIKDNGTVGRQKRLELAHALIRRFV